MSQISILDLLYAKSKTPLEFNFDSLLIPPMESYLTLSDIEGLYNIATSIRFNGNITKKLDAINQIMRNRGFKKFAGGTNRVIYSYLEDTRFVAKIAIDKVGLGDNPAEYQNQFLLSPFVAKTFQVSPGGVLALSERVKPITTIEEFSETSDEIFDILVFNILGKYVVDDVGTQYFMNWGVRSGFGACLLDYPYVFDLDGSKLICNKFIMDENRYCFGKIDYDYGFNTLVCTKCGKRFTAKELKKDPKSCDVILKGEKIMKVYLEKADGTKLVPEQASDFIEKPLATRKPISTAKELKVVLVRNGEEIPVEEPKKEEPVVTEETPSVDETTQEEYDVTVEETLDTTNTEEVKSSDEVVEEEVTQPEEPIVEEDVTEEPAEENETESEEDEVESESVEIDVSSKFIPKRDSRGRFTSTDIDEDDYDYEFEEKPRTKTRKQKRNNDEAPSKTRKTKKDYRNSKPKDLDMF